MHRRQRNNSNRPSRALAGPLQDDVEVLEHLGRDTLLDLDNTWGLAAFPRREEPDVGGVLLDEVDGKLAAPRQILTEARLFKEFIQRLALHRQCFGHCDVDIS